MLQNNLYTKHELRFHPNGKFKILMVSDLHGCGMDRPCYDVEPKGDLEALVEASHPDLVLFAGDNTGGRYGVATEDELKTYLDWITEILEKNHILWAHVYGNHDNEDGNVTCAPGVPLDIQQQIYESYEHCISKRGPRDIHGVGNYVLPIKSSVGDTIAFNIWGLDSHQEITQFEKEYGLEGNNRTCLDKNIGGNTGFDTVRFDQVVWYWNSSKQLEAYNRAPIPGLMYFHTPLHEHAMVLLNPERTGLRDVVGRPVTDGLSDIFCAPVNQGLFSAVLQRGDVKAIYCGHTHVSFEGTYCGIRLGFDGGMSYSNSGTLEECRGGRIFELDENSPGELRSYMLRLMDIRKPQTT